MIVKRRSSAEKILNTSGAPGFIRGRKYDTDMDRLGRATTQREITQVGDLGKEIRKMRNELNDGRLGRWRSTD